MRIKVLTVSKKLTELMTSEQWNTLTGSRDWKNYELTIQNLWDVDIYIEISKEATVKEWYVLKKDNRLEITMNRINELNLIADKEENDNIRIITT